MPARDHIIYIPGLSDKGLLKKSQQLGIFLWRLRFGITTETFVVGWESKAESFDQKLKRILKRIDAVHATGKRVSLVAASAGASMATNAFALRPEAIHRVVVVAGALGPVEDAGPVTLALNPAFKTALERQPAAIQSLTPADRARMLSIKPQQDRVVPLHDMDIEGIHYLNLSIKGHLKTIGRALTTHSKDILLFITHE
jgi:pimeloyl-ACP methyl ester carboxylesterase